MKAFAVFGNPIAHSLSPVIHYMFAKQAKIEISYDKCLSTHDTFDADITKFMSGEEVCGCNITAPFKLNAYELADKLDSKAQLARSVNTLFYENRKHLVGFNTDGFGLVYDLKRILGSIAGANILIYGAGGASQGAIADLLDEQVSRITVANRTLEKAKILVEHFSNKKVIAAPLSVLASSFDIVINATSAGLMGKSIDFPKANYSNVKLAYDMTYSAQKTPFLEFASYCGVQHSSDGLGMLVGQAAKAFEIWTGFQPDPRTTLVELKAKIDSP